MKNCAGFGRGLCCTALIVLMAISGFMGMTRHGEKAAVSVPIVFEALENDLWIAAGEEPQNRLAKERERALALLDDVIRETKASDAAIQKALQEKTKIAVHIETEARIVQMLENMGFQGMAAFCGGTMTTVIVPQGIELPEKMRVQVVDTAANASKLPADSIKIILAKK